MQINEIRQLQVETKIMDNRTGEQLNFVSFPIESAYVICRDYDERQIWLTPDRIEIVR